MNEIDHALLVRILQAVERIADATDRRQSLVAPRDEPTKDESRARVVHWLNAAPGPPLPKSMKAIGMAWMLIATLGYLADPTKAASWLAVANNRHLRGLGKIRAERLRVWVAQRRWPAQRWPQ